jgi:hypothetical protein
MTTRRRVLLGACALLMTLGLSGCDWDPTVCVGKDATIAVCV